MCHVSEKKEIIQNVDSTFCNRILTKKVKNEITVSASLSKDKDTYA